MLLADVLKAPIESLDGDELKVRTHVDNFFDEKGPLLFDASRDNDPKIPRVNHVLLVSPHIWDVSLPEEKGGNILVNARTDAAVKEAVKHWWGINGGVATKPTDNDCLSGKKLCVITNHGGRAIYGVVGGLFEKSGVTLDQEKITITREMLAGCQASLDKSGTPVLAFV